MQICISQFDEQTQGRLEWMVVENYTRRARYVERLDYIIGGFLPSIVYWKIENLVVSTSFAFVRKTFVQSCIKCKVVKLFPHFMKKTIKYCQVSMHEDWSGLVWNNIRRRVCPKIFSNLAYRLKFHALNWLVAKPHFFGVESIMPLKIRVSSRSYSIEPWFEFN